MSGTGHPGVSIFVPGALRQPPLSASTASAATPMNATAVRNGSGPVVSLPALDDRSSVKRQFKAMERAPALGRSRAANGDGNLRPTAG